MYQTLATVGKFFTKHSAVFAIGGVILGCAYSIYKTYKVAPKVQEQIAAAHKLKNDEALTLKERLKAMRPMIKPIVVFAAAMAILVVFGVSTHRKISGLSAQLAGSAAACAVANNANGVVDMMQGKHPEDKSIGEQPPQIPSGRCIWVEDITGVEIEATYADVIAAYAAINRYTDTATEVSIADFLDQFETTNTGSNGYPRSAYLFGWVNNEYSRVPTIEPDLQCSEATLKRSGLPAFRLCHTIEPTYIKA